MGCQLGVVAFLGLGGRDIADGLEQASMVEPVDSLEGGDLHGENGGEKVGHGSGGMMANQKLLIIDELGFVPLSKTGAELLFELISQRYERGATLITSNLPFDEWTEVFGSERLTGALLDRLTHHVNILEMNGDSYRLSQSRTRTAKVDGLPMRPGRP